MGVQTFFLHVKYVWAGGPHTSIFWGIHHYQNSDVTDSHYSTITTTIPLTYEQLPLPEFRPL